MVVVVYTGCAACHSPDMGPLMDAETFDSIEAAKAELYRRDPETIWKLHPQGGEYFDYGQGSTWIMPIEVASSKIFPEMMYDY